MIVRWRMIAGPFSKALLFLAIMRTIVSDTEGSKAPVSIRNESDNLHPGEVNASPTMTSITDSNRPIAWYSPGETAKTPTSTINHGPASVARCVFVPSGWADSSHSSPTTKHRERTDAGESKEPVDDDTALDSFLKNVLRARNELEWINEVVLRRVGEKKLERTEKSDRYFGEPFVRRPAPFYRPKIRSKRRWDPGSDSDPVRPKRRENHVVDENWDPLSDRTYLDDDTRGERRDEHFQGSKDRTLTSLKNILLNLKKIMEENEKKISEYIEKETKDQQGNAEDSIQGAVSAAGERGGPVSSGATDSLAKVRAKYRDFRDEKSISSKNYHQESPELSRGDENFEGDGLISGPNWWENPRSAGDAFDWKRREDDWNGERSDEFGIEKPRVDYIVRRVGRDTSEETNGNDRDTKARRYTGLGEAYQRDGKNGRPSRDGGTQIYGSGPDRRAVRRIKAGGSDKPKDEGFDADRGKSNENEVEVAVKTMKVKNERRSRGSAGEFARGNVSGHTDAGRDGMLEGGVEQSVIKDAERSFGSVPDFLSGRSEDREVRLTPGSNESTASKVVRKKEVEKSEPTNEDVRKVSDTSEGRKKAESAQDSSTSSSHRVRSLLAENVADRGDDRGNERETASDDEDDWDSDDDSNLDDESNDENGLERGPRESSYEADETDDDEDELTEQDGNEEDRSSSEGRCGEPSEIREDRDRDKGRVNSSMERKLRDRNEGSIDHMERTIVQPSESEAYYDYENENGENDESLPILERDHQQLSGGNRCPGGSCNLRLTVPTKKNEYEEALEKRLKEQGGTTGKPAKQEFISEVDLENVGVKKPKDKKVSFNVTESNRTNNDLRESADDLSKVMRSDSVANEVTTKLGGPAPLDRTNNGKENPSNDGAIPKRSALKPTSTLRHAPKLKRSRKKSEKNVPVAIPSSVDENSLDSLPTMLDRSGPEFSIEERTYVLVSPVEESTPSSHVVRNSSSSGSDYLALKMTDDLFKGGVEQSNPTEEGVPDPIELSSPTTEWKIFEAADGNGRVQSDRGNNFSRLLPSREDEIDPHSANAPVESSRSFESAAFRVRRNERNAGRQYGLNSEDVHESFVDPVDVAAELDNETKQRFGRSLKYVGNASIVEEEPVEKYLEGGQSDHRNEGISNSVGRTVVCTGVKKDIGDVFHEGEMLEGKAKSSLDDGNGLTKRNLENNGTTGLCDIAPESRGKHGSSNVEEWELNPPIVKKQNSDLVSKVIDARAEHRSVPVLIGDQVDEKVNIEPKISSFANISTKRERNDENERIRRDAESRFEELRGHSSGRRRRWTGNEIDEDQGTWLRSNAVDYDEWNDPMNSLDSYERANKRAYSANDNERVRLARQEPYRKYSRMNSIERRSRSSHRRKGSSPNRVGSHRRSIHFRAPSKDYKRHASRAISNGLTLRQESNRILRATPEKGPPRRKITMLLNDDDETDDESQMDSALDGELAEKIVEHIFAEVQKNEDLKTVIGPGLDRKRKSDEAINADKIYRQGLDADEGRHAETTMKRVMELLGQLVLDEVRAQTCTKLPPDLRDFLDWILRVDDEEFPDDVQGPPLPDINKKKCKHRGSDESSTKASTSGTERDNVDEVYKKVRLLRTLINEYNALSMKEKTKVQSVRDYLAQQLDLLLKYIEVKERDESKHEENSEDSIVRYEGAVPRSNRTTEVNPTLSSFARQPGFLTRNNSSYVSAPRSSRDDRRRSKFRRVRRSGNVGTRNLRNRKRKYDERGHRKRREHEKRARMTLYDNEPNESLEYKKLARRAAILRQKRANIYEDNWNPMDSGYEEARIYTSSGKLTDRGKLNREYETHRNAGGDRVIGDRSKRGASIESNNVEMEADKANDKSSKRRNLAEDEATLVSKREAWRKDNERQLEEVAFGEDMRGKFREEKQFERSTDIDERKNNGDERIRRSRNITIKSNDADVPVDYSMEKPSTKSFLKTDAEDEFSLADKLPLYESDVLAKINVYPVNEDRGIRGLPKGSSDVERGGPVDNITKGQRVQTSAATGVNVSRKNSDSTTVSYRLATKNSSAIVEPGFDTIDRD